jgi:hypothetical protein
LKINRGGFTVYREDVPRDQNPVLSAKSYRDGTIDHMENFFACVKSRKEPNAPVETGVAAARAGHIGNYAYLHGGQFRIYPQPTGTASECDCYLGPDFACCDSGKSSC